MYNDPVWCDPPQGYLYGFPKIYNPKKDPPFYEWIVQKGYPQQVIDSYEGQFYCRYWKVTDDNK